MLTHQSSHHVSLTPRWFAKAKQAGADEAALRQLVRQFCEEALANRGTPETLDESWIDLMLDMYQAAWEQESHAD